MRSPSAESSELLQGGGVVGAGTRASVLVVIVVEFLVVVDRAGYHV